MATAHGTSLGSIIMYPDKANIPRGEKSNWFELWTQCCHSLFFFLDKKQKSSYDKPNIQKSPKWLQNIQHNTSYFELNCKGDGIH